MKTQTRKLEDFRRPAAAIEDLFAAIRIEYINSLEAGQFGMKAPAVATTATGGFEVYLNATMPVHGTSFYELSMRTPLTEAVAVWLAGDNRKKRQIRTALKHLRQAARLCEEKLPAPKRKGRA